MPIAMHDSRFADRTPVHYTMKTHSRPVAGGPVCHAVAHPPRTSKSTKPTPTTTTPQASPRAPYSVGQNTPPVLSPARHHDARASSPNYFGLVVESSTDPRESSGLGRDNWSPASSSIKSFAAALPKQQLPLEPNPEFEAFRRQADINWSMSFALSAAPNSKTATARARPPRLPTPASDAHPTNTSSVAPPVNTSRDRLTTKMDVDHDDEAAAQSSTRPSIVPTQITSMPVSDSPPIMDSPCRSPKASRPPTAPARTDGRLSMAVDPPAPMSSGAAEAGGRAITLPPKLDAGGPSMISDTRLKELMESIDNDRLLLLDIRSLQSYAQSRIRGALNLCIPTTLLKRPNFNIEKLKQTFQGGSESTKFADWRRMSWIIVYDAHAWESREAVTAQNMIKKFTNEGFTGETAILRGGFNIFHKSFPWLIDDGSANPPPARGGRNGRGNAGLAPVIGGVNLPASTGEVDPFFSNIRQNVDLADGVGQMEVTRPSGLDSPLLPLWLREAASTSDRGRRVADKFLRIELDEQARMRSAYAAFKPGAQGQGQSKFQLSGVEKGGKNRYKDILPFEHARVRLQDKTDGSCDYVNASHLGTSRSHKRYIASQGPLPATFEDFWSVVWQQDVRVIVMLTAESEGGQLKCHPYWKGREFGAIKLRLVSEKKASLDMDKHRGDTCATCSAAEFGRKRANTTTTIEATATAGCAGCQGQGQTEAPYVVIRKFVLAHAAHPFAPMREITHLHFPAWPDFGTPAKPSHLLALVELANLMQRAARPIETTSLFGAGRSAADDHVPASWYDEPENDSQMRPMLVHCSAGCGRTGTFCAVDSVIDILKRQRQAKLAAMRGVDEDDEAISPRSSGIGAVAATANQTVHASEAAWVRDETQDLIETTVHEFREQRLSMVQSLRQYVLCYETMLEWTHRMNERSANMRLRSGSLKQARRNR
ncbi:hypothetical protein CP532_3166 [Ophiocordyceps camponoti-leonardi (nom. inval.)]|nr:hypothetical protein CP532_3166 [Ophiocordyceps camponoti-leonardi (nom. inval.)]